MPFVRLTLKSLIPKDIAFEAKTLGEHLRKRRLVLGITQKQAAKLLGINEHTILHWEVRRTKPGTQWHRAYDGKRERFTGKPEELCGLAKEDAEVKTKTPCEHSDASAPFLDNLNQKRVQ